LFSSEIGFVLRNRAPFKLPVSGLVLQVSGQKPAIGFVFSQPENPALVIILCHN
jgi:hypothetical protein